MSRLISAALIVVSTGTALASASGAQSAAPPPVAQPAGVSARSVARTPPMPRVIAAARPAVPTMIQGNALNSTNGQVANAVVRLRDARFGRIVGTEITDQSGLFAFRNVDPGTYIVEMMAADESSVLAASQLLNVNAGEVVSAVVKLPFRVPPFAGAMGVNSTPTATLLATQAAANGVIAIASTTPVSPNQ